MSVTVTQAEEKKKAIENLSHADCFKIALDNLVSRLREETVFLQDFFFDPIEEQKDEDGERRVVETKGDLTRDKMIAAVFENMQEELTRLVQLGQEADPFSSLETLLLSEEVLDTYTSYELLDFSLRFLQNTQRLLFNKFVDGQIQWVQSQKPGAKRAGVLEPIRKLPSFIQRIVDTGRGSNQNRLVNATNTTFQKIISSVFKWLADVATKDEKYTNVVNLENYNFFRCALREINVEALVTQQEVADRKYAESMKAYVAWNVTKELETLDAFWSRLDEELQATAADQIMFVDAVNQQKLRALCKTLTEKAMAKNVDGMRKRIQKHLQKNTLLIELTWENIRSYFLNRYSTFEKLVATCYQNEKLPLSSTAIADIFKKVEMADEAAQEKTKDKEAASPMKRSWTFGSAKKN
jgi:hypothetical protein